MNTEGVSVEEMARGLGDRIQAIVQIEEFPAEIEQVILAALATAQAEARCAAFEEAAQIAEAQTFSIVVEWGLNGMMCQKVRDAVAEKIRAAALRARGDTP